MSSSSTFDGMALDGTVTFFFLEDLLSSEDVPFLFFEARLAEAPLFLLCVDLFPVEVFVGVLFCALELLEGVFLVALGAVEGGVFFPLEDPKLL
jgi:hypothetical protein